MRSLAWTLSVALLGVVHSASAQNEAAVAEAYQKAAQGLREFKSGHFAQALDDYTRAYAIVHLPALAVHIARANVGLGHFVAALRFYDEALELGDGVGEPQVQARARLEAKVERAALLPRIPRIVFGSSGVTPKAVRLQVDGAVIPLAAYEAGWLVDPGSHQVVASLGTQQQAQWVAVSEREVREVRFTFAAPPPSTTNRIRDLPRSEVSLSTAPPLTRRIAWASVGIGGVGLLVWGTAGVVALNKSSDLKSRRCGADLPPCPESELRSYNNWKTAATVGFYTGAAALLTGATLFLVEPKQKKSRESGAHMVPWLGFGSAGVEGQF